MWYAVDRDGHVASLWSGEAGDVPTEFPESLDQALNALIRLLPVQETIYSLQGRLTPTEEGDCLPYHIERTGGSVLMFLSSLEPVQEDLAAGRATRLRGREAEVVWFPRLIPQTHQQVHESGACLSCFYFWSSANPPGRTSWSLFSYTHLWENWAPGPYGLQTIPSQPVHIDQLPPALRAELLRVRFDQSFDQTAHLWPEHCRVERPYHRPFEEPAGHEAAGDVPPLPPVEPGDDEIPF
jgi:hypothetical protein